MFRRGWLIPGRIAAVALALVAGPLPAATAPATTDQGVAKRLAGFDAWMEKLVEDWNVPGIGVAVVAKDQVVLAKGWGYRDYGRKLPFTPKTVTPIASNTKLFTAVAAGLLVEEGKLAWDAPVKQFVPSVRFYDDRLGVAFVGAPFQKLVPWKPHKFRVPEFADVVVEFVVEGESVVAMKQTDPSGEYTFPRK
jgi:CubicO group peptidase (beta-lactamase class C family)